MKIPKPPNIKITPLEEVTSGKPFLKVQRDKCRIDYPGGNSREMVLDSIARRQPDASIILPYELHEGKVHVWLRSALRSAAAIRHSKDKDFKYTGNMWEFPAGLIDDGETPQEAAARECHEEAGFQIPAGKFELIREAMSIPSNLPEILFFYAVNVGGIERGEPTLDGSALEEGGKVIRIPLEDMITQGLPDMKTAFGAMILQNFLKSAHGLG